MKISYKITALLAGSALLLSSCAVDGVYGSVGMAGPGYNASVAWSNASYDANGFPIFGYTNGQPVYGYTAAGAAVLSFAALTALCFVPQWGPAPWYRGPWHYPPRIHRVPAPPHCPPGHMPHMRPSGGLNAPIHRNPNSVLRPPHNSHGPALSGKPNGGSHGNRPPVPNGMGKPGRPNHGAGNVSQPGRPNHGLGKVSQPGRHNHGVVNVSQPGKPNHVAGIVSQQGGFNRGSGSVSRPGGFSRPSGGAGGHAGRGGHHR